MAAEGFGTKSRPVTFMVAAGLVFEIIAAMCSSPQTAEININKRADTLMKWVTIGMLISVVFILVAMTLDEDRWPTILGGGLAGGIMWFAYDYARQSGMRTAQQGTED